MASTEENTSLEAANDNPISEGGELLTAIDSDIENTLQEPQVTEEINHWARVIADLRRQRANDNEELKEAA